MPINPDPSSPTVYTIAAHLPFTDTLAAGINDAVTSMPEALARYRIMLPTRRSCRSLREAFLRLSGGAPLLLPRLSPIGDVDEDDLFLSGGFEINSPADTVLSIPAAIPGLKRQLILMQLITKQSPDISADQAALLASELANLIDQVATEQLDFADLEGLVDRSLSEHLAEHWQDTLKFLKIVTEHWPSILADQHMIDPAHHRNLLLQAEATAWKENPPNHPVIAAGSTGSIPATAELLNTIACMPQGCVVLPGLDREMDDETWNAISTTHPQYGLKLLLEHMNLSRHNVANWPHTSPTLNQQGAPKSRTDLLRLALLPASVTGQPIDRGTLDSAALEGVQQINCPDPGRESEIIALIMRKTLETPGQTSALITPDRNLARRVRAELKRWDIEVDDSAGTPLAQTPPGTYLRLCAAMVAHQLAPLDLLAALKHPLAAGGENPATFRTRVRLLETNALHGPRPAAGFKGLGNALDKEKHVESIAFVERLEVLAASFSNALNQDTLSLKTILKAHIDFAEALSASHEETGVARLWRREAGEALSGFVAELHDALDDNAGLNIHARNYPALFNTLLMGRVVRPRFGAHPRLNIWGPLEARLQHADVLILGSLNEGIWPREPDPGPWMSRPMMAAFGLPLPERRIGLSAHDFAQAFCAPHVILTRAERNDGTPTVPSRWLRRIDNLISKTPLRDKLYADHGWLELSLALDDAKQIKPEQPRPCPPINARPNRLSVTRVRTLQRDPYAIYAREVLKLKPKDPIDADPGAADRGNIIHNALDVFIKKYPVDLPDDAEQQLILIGEEQFAPFLSRPGIRAFWWPRFLRIATWFIENEKAIRANEQFSAVTESRGKAKFNISTGEFTLTAIADRIDTLGHGGLAIIDYKTGAPPSAKQAEAGLEPQLPLEAAIIKNGAFEDLATDRVEQLSYYRLSGGRVPGKIHHLKFDVEDVAEKTWEGFKELIHLYDDADMPYLSHTRPIKQNDYGDYDHLARLKEWKSVGDEE